MFLDVEKVPYPPAYSEIYPPVAVENENTNNMGWLPADQNVSNSQPTIVQQPPNYGTTTTSTPQQQAGKLLV